MNLLTDSFPVCLYQIIFQTWFSIFRSSALTWISWLHAPHGNLVTSLEWVFCVKFIFLMLDYLFYYRNANSSLPMSSVEDAIVQIEDTLYYFSDVMSSGIPDLERFITENILQVLVFRFLLPSLQRQSTVSAEKHFTYYLIYFCVGFLFLIFYYNFFL